MSGPLAALTEPTTLATDYLLAALCLFCAASLGKRSRAAGGRAVSLWVAAFSVTALAALAGGTAHGFRIPLGESWQLLWSATVASIAAGSVLLIAAGVRSAMKPQARSEAARRNGIQWLKRAIVLSLAGLAVLVGKLSLHPHFNQNDLYHVIQLGGLYALYRAALLLHGLNGSGS